MSQQRIKALLSLRDQVRESHLSLAEPPKLFDESFEKQTSFLKDKAKLKAALCTRRAGKSYGGASLMFQTAIDNPGSSVLYIALTRDSAKKIMWKDCIKVIDRKHVLGCKFNETELTATMSNGSVLYLTGADAKPDEMEKLLGQKYALVVIDEAASWRQNLHTLVYKILKPAVADYRGAIVMVGTPGNFTKSFFHEVTEGKWPSWSVHKWSAHDNPHMAKNWAEEIDELKRDHPGIEDTPLFRQMYLGEWFVDTEKLCYKFKADKNLTPTLPVLVGKVHYVLGVDLGYSDSTAFSLCAYSEHNEKLFVVRAFKHKGMIISDVAERVKAILRDYDALVVFDASNLQAVEEIRQRYGIPVIAAEKTNKAEFIEIMNADFILGRIQLIEDETKGLVEEYSSLVWDENSPKRQEHPACENHLADSTLYAWRYSYNYFATPYLKKPAPHTEAAVDEFWEQEGNKHGKVKSILDMV